MQCLKNLVGNLKKVMKNQRSVPELINYFKTVIEENSKPDFASEEIEALDAYVKQGGDLRNTFQIDAELDLDDIDLDEESNQKRLLLRCC